MVAQHTNLDRVAVSTSEEVPLSELLDFLCVKQYLPRVNIVDHPGTEQVKDYSTH